MLSFGYYEEIDGDLFAVEGETWTFDHGTDALEGWRSIDRTAGEFPNSFRRITTADWNTNNPGISAPIPAGSGAVWVGLYQTEADAAGWAGGLGYGNSWCHTLTSPVLTYTGNGDVDLEFDYFNNTEADYDFTNVRLLLGDGTDVPLDSFTGVDGNPATSTYLAYARTLTAADFLGETSFQIVFEMTADEAFDDEDGFYNTTYGPFAADNISVTGSVVEGDQLWDFEATDHGFVASQCGVIGDFFGVADVSDYDGLDCEVLDGFVAEFHNDDEFHPEGQWAYVYSPAVDISTISPDSIWFEFDIYSLLNYEDGVVYRVGWEYYPTSPGGSEWSDRIGDTTYYFTEVDPVCARFVESAKIEPEDFPSHTERIRVVFELRSDREAFSRPPCTMEPCNGNFSPLLDNTCIKIEVPSGGASIAGNVFQDVEGDCSPDPDGEIYTRFVKLEPGGKIATVRGDGSFLFKFLDAGDYDVSLLEKAHWEQTCPASDASYTLSLAADSAAVGTDFGTNPSADVVDIACAIGATEARPGFSYIYRMDARNIGTITSDSVDLTLELPGDVTFDAATSGGVFTPTGGDPSESIGDVTWRISGLDPETVRGLGVKLTLPTTMPLGTMLTATVTVSEPGDVDDTNDIATDIAVVVGSFDPNDKQVDPDGDILADQLLAYHINFQNVGTASAINVVVRDTLDANLDISTLTIGAASHDYVLDINDRELVWTFEGIELPDSTSNEPESHGFVEFTARPIDGLVPGDEISNRAGIYFDFNEVVLTNTVVSTVADPTSGIDSEPSSETSHLRWRSVAPNPTSAVTTLSFISAEAGRMRGSVYGVDGREVRKLMDGAIKPGTTNISWDGRSNEGRSVPGGVYFVRMRLDGDSGSREELEARIVRIE